jgi:hypothetical protein
MLFCEASILSCSVVILRMNVNEYMEGYDNMEGYTLMCAVATLGALCITLTLLLTPAKVCGHRSYCKQLVAVLKGSGKACCMLYCSCSAKAVPWNMHQLSRACWGPRPLWSAATRTHDLLLQVWKVLEEECVGALALKMLRPLMKTLPSCSSVHPAPPNRAVGHQLGLERHSHSCSVPRDSSDNEDEGASSMQLELQADHSDAHAEEVACTADKASQ